MLQTLFATKVLSELGAFRSQHKTMDESLHAVMVELFLWMKLDLSKHFADISRESNVVGSESQQNVREERV